MVNVKMIDKIRASSRG